MSLLVLTTGNTTANCAVQASTTMYKNHWNCRVESMFKCTRPDRKDIWESMSDGDDSPSDSND